MVQNDTTKSLEGQARSRGLHIKVFRTGTRTQPSYVVTKRENIDLVPPMCIGNTIRDAESWVAANQVTPSNRRGRSFDPVPKRPMKLL